LFKGLAIFVLQLTVLDWHGIGVNGIRIIAARTKWMARANHWLDLFFNLQY
jgi:hypothetical protein